jgi:hypothetical protein
VSREAKPVSCTELKKSIQENPILSNLFGVELSSTYLEYIEKLNQCSATDK